jgi:hypothetical protein
MTTMTDDTNAPSPEANDEGLPPLETGAPRKEAAPERPESDDAPEGDADAPREAAEGEDGEADAEGKPKKPSGYQRQKARADTLAQENAELKAALGRIGGGSALDPANEASIEAEVLNRVGPPPKQSDFQDLTEYYEEMQAWRTDKRAARREVLRDATASKSQSEADVQLVLRAHKARVDEFRKEVPDFDQAIAEADRKGLDAQPHVLRAMLSSDLSAELQYHLIKSPQILRDLNRSSPEEAARKIGRLEASLEAGKPSAKTTNAPEPARNPRGGAAAPVDLGKADMEQYAAARRKQEAARRGSANTRH